MKRVAVLGAGGILGQTMMLYEPEGAVVRYYRRSSTEMLFYQLNVFDFEEEFDDFLPEVVVNLAGENSPDVVEKDPGKYYELNAIVPARLGAWCEAHGAHFVQVSTQAVFSGNEPPYHAGSHTDPINRYGRQKAEAEENAMEACSWCTVVRPTFVLGVRPLPHIGRQNPFEHMVDNPHGIQVSDRYFSPLFARAGARALWDVCLKEKRGQQFTHLGSALTTTRAEIAKVAGFKMESVPHDYFKLPAPRPIDTTYEYSFADENPLRGVDVLQEDIKHRGSGDLVDRAQEIALFLRCSEQSARERLEKGFRENHRLVAEDFGQDKDEVQLTSWYQNTSAYIWELSAYHMDEGFNYKGSVQGVVDQILGDLRSDVKVMVLADGIGSMTLALREAGINAVYNDLEGSLTGMFGRFRLWRNLGEIGETHMSDGFQPIEDDEEYDYVVCYDFLEHVPNVEEWVEAIYRLLNPGGAAVFQNAFGIGSQPGPGAEQGPIPMHLKENDHWIKDWTPLMVKVGFHQVGTSNWWERPARKGS